MDFRTTFAGGNSVLGGSQMRCLNRNKRPFYYCQYLSKVSYVDEYGNESGEQIATYSDPVKMFANISQATGISNTEQFGTLENYDKVLVTDNMNCPIDEHSVLFVDKMPEYVSVVTHVPTAVTTVDEIRNVPVFDYTVTRVAKSLNSISIAIKKVDVS